MSIVSDADFAVYIRNETGAEDAAMNAAAKAAAEGYVKRYCQRSFELSDTVATARTFIPVYGWRVLRVHDFSTTSGLIVSNNGTAVTSTDYQLEPVNGIDWSGQASPYEQICLLTSSWYTYNGQATATVTAKWGWASVPGEVVEAVKLLGKDWVQQRSTTLGYVSTQAGPAGTGGRNWAAMNLLAPWRRVEAFGIG